jgi:integrase
MRLTDKAVAALTVPADRSEIIVFDEMLPGFGIRIRKGGSRRYVYQYKIGDINRRFTFKEADVIRARRAAERLAAQVTLGADPALDKTTAHSAAGDTFKRCLERYLSRPQGRRRNTTIDAVRRHLLLNLQPIHHLHLKKIDRRRVAEELSRITAENGAVQANRTRTSLIGFLRWCVGEGYLDTNVAIQTNRNEETPRSRVLTDVEIGAVWQVGRGEIGDILKLLLLTALRRDEIGGLRWSEIDFDKRVINIPGSRMKNHRPHCIPLTDAAITILRSRPRVRECVFGLNGIGYSGWSQAKLRIDEAAQIAPWTFHDLRRTAATRMAELGVMPHVVEAVLGHVSGFRSGVAGVYNHATYEPEKRRALEVWEQHLLSSVL